MTDYTTAAEEIPLDQKPGADKEDEATGKFLTLARKRFQATSDFEQQNRKDAVEDLKFLSGDQWEESLKAAREEDCRPALTINHLPKFVNQVVNDNALNRPMIKVSPVDDAGDTEVAEVYQGIIRHIENQSDAAAAYDTALHHAADAGWGYIRVVNEYADNGLDNGEQDILIERIRNRFTVYMDHNAQKLDCSDAKYCFISEEIIVEEFKEEWPDADVESWELLSGEDQKNWTSEGKIRVAEYFVVENTPREIKLEGSTEEEEITKEGESLPPNARIVQDRTVHHYRITGKQVLEKNEWAGKWIPLIPVYGQEIDVAGKLVRNGLVRHAKDPQRNLNYHQSAMTEEVALRPKAPFVGAEGQFEGHEAKWKDANRRAYPYLEYRPKSFGGELAPPPQRQPSAEIPQGNMAVLAQSIADLNDTTGIYESGLGKQTEQDPSGKAILARQKVVDVGSAHYSKGLERALRHVGRILIDLIPKTYDTERVVRSIGEDNSESLIQLGTLPGVAGEDPRAVGETTDTEGKARKIYDLSIGKYDVVVSTGPSFATKRQESSEHMLRFAEILGPEQSTWIADLIAGNQDWPGADKIAERLKRMLPPELQEPDPEAEESAEQRAQAAESQLAELEPQMQEMQAAIQQMMAELNSRDKEHQLEAFKAHMSHDAELAESEGHVKAAVINALGGMTPEERYTLLLGLNPPTPPPQPVQQAPQTPAQPPQPAGQGVIQQPPQPGLPPEEGV